MVTFKAEKVDENNCEKEYDDGGNILEKMRTLKDNHDLEAVDEVYKIRLRYIKLFKPNCIIPILIILLLAVSGVNYLSDNGFMFFTHLISITKKAWGVTTSAFTLIYTAYTILNKNQKK